MLFRLARHRSFWAACAAAVLLLVAGLYWFQPWRLVTDTVVADAVPELAPAPAAADSPAAAPVPPSAGAPSSPAADSSAASSPAADSPGAPVADRNRLLSSGTFVTHEHETTGTVQVVRLADGRRQLVLRGLATSDGPDLRVWLSDQPVKRGAAGWRVFDDGAYHEVSRLRGNRGNQVYDLPASVDLAELRSVSIWCKRFAVSFGAAALEPA